MVTFNKKVFEGGITVPINCYNDSTSALAVSTSGNNEIWELDPAGIYSIIVNVTSVAGGNVTVKVKGVMVQR